MSLRDWVWWYKRRSLPTTYSHWATKCEGYTGDWIEDWRDLKKSNTAEEDEENGSFTLCICVINKP